MRIMIFLYYIGHLSEVNTQNQTIVRQKPRVKLSIIDPITLGDIFISVKTTHKNHKTRLSIILRTWYQLAIHQTWFFTDRDDKVLQKYTHGHMVNTHCPPTHELFDLCCKTNVEFDTYIRSDKKWFCHFDDDVFVNVPRLLEFLKTYNHSQDWYLGKNNVNYDPINITVPVVQNKTVTSWFPASFTNALGPAYCISESLAKRMSPYASYGRFINICQQTQRVEDQAMGYLSEFILKVKLTQIDDIHTHFEDMSKLDPSSFPNQVSFSYLLPNNVVKVPGPRMQGDHTGFLTLYEHLYNLKAKDASVFRLEDLEPSIQLSSWTRKPFNGRKMLRGKWQIK